MYGGSLVCSMVLRGLATAGCQKVWPDGSFSEEPNCDELRDKHTNTASAKKNLKLFTETSGFLSVYTLIGSYASEYFWKDIFGGVSRDSFLGVLLGSLFWSKSGETCLEVCLENLGWESLLRNLLWSSTWKCC